MIMPARPSLPVLVHAQEGRLGRGSLRWGSRAVPAPLTAALAAALLLSAGCGGDPASGTDGDTEVDTAPDADASEDTVAPDTAPDTAVTDTVGGDTAAPDTVADSADDDTDAVSEDVDVDVDADADADGDIDEDAGDASVCVPGDACALQIYPGPCKTGICDEDGVCAVADVPGCCLDDADCAGYVPASACEAWRCVSSQCTATTFPGCCDDVVGCDDGVTCTVDRCGPATGLCSHCPSDCACAPPVLATGFDSTAFDAGFAVVDDTAWDPVTWRVSQRRWLVPPGAAYLGRADCANYYTGTLGEDCGPADPVAQDGARVRAALVTPAFTLPYDAAAPLATVWVWSDVEANLGLGPGEPDVLRVIAEPLDGDASWELASTLAVGKDTGGAWRLLAVDLAPWVGRTLRLRFLFDTLDAQDNAAEGVYLDELRVTQGCEAGGCCETDADCADTGDPCTVGRCVGLVSGAGRTCVVTPAHPGDACAPCATAASCVDDDPCTNDVCGADGACTHEPFCCLRREVWADDFELGLARWGVLDDQPEDGVRWTASSHAFDGAYAGWFGSPASGTYATGARVRGALASPLTPLPVAGTGGGVELAFALDMDTEWTGAVDYDNPAGVDRLTVTILTVTDEIVVWTSDAIGGSTDGAWLPVVIDLTTWAGQTVQLRLTFDSVDGDGNDHGGVWIDDLSVRTSCPAGD